MPDNFVAPVPSGSTVTFRSKADASNVQTQQVGNEVATQVDGHSQTFGSTTDAAWGGAGTGSAIALLKAVYNWLASLGATGDAAVTTNAAGTASAKLRGLVAIFADVWDSTNHQLRVSGAGGSGGTQYQENATHTTPATGTLGLGVRQDAGYTPLATASGNYMPMSFDDQGQLRVAPGQLIAQNATVSRVAASAASVQILAANTARVGAMVMNDSNATCYLLEGTGTASATNFSVKLAPNDPNGMGGYFETPYGYASALQAVWSQATGAAMVTENS